MSPRRARRSALDARRPLIVAGLALALAIVGFAGAVTSSTAQSAAPVRPSTLVASPDAESSLFTCGGLGVAADGPATGSVIITNTTDQARTAAVTALSDTGERVGSLVALRPQATATLDPGQLLTSGTWAAATVAISGGGVGVTEQINGSNGASVSPCASSAATSWYFTGGSTSKGQQLSISVVNPTSTPAVVNATFISSSAGAATPQGSQGLVVAPRSLIVINASALDPHAPVMATTVTATQGTVVAFATQISPDPVATSVTLGETSFRSSWLFPRAIAAAGTSVDLEVANPTAVTQIVTVRVRLASGWDAPWVQTIDPYASWQLQLSPSSRVPQSDTYFGVVTSSGPGVSAFLSSRVPDAGSGGWGLAPLVGHDVLSALEWALTPIPGEQRGGISLVNPTLTTLSVALRVDRSTGTVSLGRVRAVVLQPHAILNIPGSELAAADDAPIIVTASGPLGVAQSVTGAASFGVSTLNGLPLSN